MVDEKYVFCISWQKESVKAHLGSNALDWRVCQSISLKQQLRRLRRWRILWRKEPGTQSMFFSPLFLFWNCHPIDVLLVPKTCCDCCENVSWLTKWTRQLCTRLKHIAKSWDYETPSQSLILFTFFRCPCFTFISLVSTAFLFFWLLFWSSPDTIASVLDPMAVSNCWHNACNDVALLKRDVLKSCNNKFHCDALTAVCRSLELSVTRFVCRMARRESFISSFACDIVSDSGSLQASDRVVTMAWVNVLMNARISGLRLSYMKWFQSLANIVQIIDLQRLLIDWIAGWATEGPGISDRHLQPFRRNVRSRLAYAKLIVADVVQTLEWS